MPNNPTDYLNDTTALSPKARKTFKVPPLISSPTILLMLAACANSGNNQSSLIAPPAGSDGKMADDSGVTLEGSADGEALKGSSGNDTLKSSAGDDTLDGGAGAGDTADYSNAPAGAVVDLDSGTAEDGWGNTDTLSNIENVTGSDYVDIITGNEAANTLRGGAGDDELYGGDGADTLYGGDGGDTLDGGIGNDTLYGGDDVDWLMGDSGDDELNGGAGGDLLFGGAGNDTLNGGTGNDFMWGGADNDTLNGGNGVDRLDGGAGINELTGGLGDDHFILDTTMNADSTSYVKDFKIHSSETDKIVINVASAPDNEDLALFLVNVAADDTTAELTIGDLVLTVSQGIADSSTEISEESHTYINATYTPGGNAAQAISHKMILENFSANDLTVASFEFVTPPPDFI